jgi:cell division protein FtsW
MKKGHNPDYIFISCIIILAVFGLVILSSASSDTGKIKFNDTYYYLKHQIIFGLSLGIVGFLIASNFYYQNWKKIAVYALLINIILLLLVFTPLGFAHRGASRWLDIGPFSFQPAEFLKITFIVYLAAWLSNKKSGRQKSFLKGFVPFIVISGIIGGLVLSQPATTILIIVMASALIVYFASGLKMSHLFLIVLLGIIALIFVIYATPYRYERVKNFFIEDETKDATSRYQINQAQEAISGGGLFGVGFGKSTTKFRYLPEPIGDSIFAVVAEELGFVGSLFLISVFILFFIRGTLIAKKANDQFGKLAVMGLVSAIAIQTFIHIGAVSGLVPLTGVPLPFISYGGTALAVFLTMSGIIVNISKYT